MITVVTGAGKGIAIALEEAGATIYVTARPSAPGENGRTALEETAASVTRMGRRGKAVAVDHADYAAVAALFSRVAHEHGRLDILVNNAAVVADPQPGGFWEKPIEAVDLITVRLHSHYVAAWHAAPVDDRERKRSDRRHRPLWRSELPSGPRLRRGKGGRRQDGGGHG